MILLNSFEFNSIIPDLTFSSMNDSLAKILTIVFQPLLMPLYGLVMLIAVPEFYGYNMLIKLIVIGIAILLMVVLPVLWYFMLVKLGVITTPQASDRRERVWAYLFTILCYAGTAAFFYAVESYTIAHVITMAVALLATVLVINFFWKISAHATGVSGLLGASISIGLAYGAYNPALYVALIMICGFVCSARLQLEAHTPAQLVAGTILGFTFMLPLLLLMW